MIFKVEISQIERRKLKNFFADSLSPLRDPVVERNRYEGLLESAMSLYTIETTQTRTIETNVLGRTSASTAMQREEEQNKSIHATIVASDK